MSRKNKKCGLIVDNVPAFPNQTKKPTHGLKCQDLATYEVHDLSGNIIGYCCEQHGIETEHLIQFANAYVSNAILAKN